MDTVVKTLRNATKVQIAPMEGQVAHFHSVEKKLTPMKNWDKRYFNNVIVVTIIIGGLYGEYLTGLSAR